MACHFCPTSIRRKPPVRSVGHARSATSLKSALLLVAAVGLRVPAYAHGFEERYDLPVPLSYVVAGACVTVFLTFIFAILFVRKRPAFHLQPANESGLFVPAKAFHWFIRLTRSVAWLLFALTIVSALWGSADPLMNLAPTFVWIIWWVGLSFAVMLLGNFWPALDPWRTTFNVLELCTRKLGISRGIAINWKWPDRLGVWPAVFFLLAWCWLEVVYPIATSPFRLGCAALIWSAVNITGMICFGRATWQQHADVFAVYFSILGRLAPVHFQRRSRTICWRPAGQGLVTPNLMGVAGQVGFVMAMLATVLFDGLHGGAVWTLFEQGLRKTVPNLMDMNGYFAGTTGLVTVWLGFLTAYLLTCRLCARVKGHGLDQTADALIAARFIPALVPIAAAYNIAHNFSNLLIQGQTVLQLLSDPLGRQWDLFGTARFYPDISIVDARLTWYVAVGSIVAGHVMSIWLSHRIALNLRLSASRTALVTLPLTVLMVAYTAISLTVIAEPMVTFTP